MAMIDLYPSRISDKAAITPRRDPVIHGERTADGPLSDEQLQFYVKNGFLFFENFFSTDEVKTMKDELNAVWAESEHADAPEVIREPGSEEVRSVFAVHRDNPFFTSLSRRRRIVDIIMQLLGSDVYVTQSRINFKPGFTGKEFYWHSDFETWHVEDGMPRMRAISCSIALTNNYNFNGPLMVVPGSHHHYVSCIGKTPENHYKKSLRKQEYGVPDPESLTWLVEQGGIVAPTGVAGSMLLFECNLMHGSNGNITPLPRSNVFMVYNSVENALAEPFSGMQPRPDFVAEREVRAIIPE